MLNTQVCLVSRPSGIPQADNFAIRRVPVPDLREGQFLVRNDVLSVEPAMRGWVSAVANYATPVGIGEVMRSFSAGEVVASKHAQYAVGDKVMGMLGWQEYSVAEPSMVTRKVRETDLPLSLSLGILGLNGVTAYFGLLDLGRPKPGDTVVVSGAAGAVGQVVGQIARLAGCRTIGIAGSDAKLAVLREQMGFDATLNYKTEADLGRAVAEVCPNGVDIYFDSVGGNISQAVFPQMALWGRVVLCGLMTQYGLAEPDVGARDMRRLLYHRVRLEGFQTEDWRDRYPEAVRRMAGWIKERKLIYTETITEGFENTPAAFIAMMRGENLGKALVKVGGTS